MNYSHNKTSLLNTNGLLKNKEIVIPILFFFFGVWYFCLRYLGTNLEFIPGDLGDSRFINYLFEHGYQWLLGNTDNFWDANFMYPFKKTIAISDNMLGTLPVYSFWRLLGFSNETSYQLWWIVMCSLNFWSAFYIIKKWFKRWDIAIIAGWIFAFTIFNVGQMNFMQMIIRFCVPFVFYASAMMVEKKKIKYLLIYCLGIVLQFYSVIYTGFFLLYFSTFFIIFYAIIKKEYLFFLAFVKKNTLFYSVLIVGLSTGAMLWLILPYLEISEILGFRSYTEVEGQIPTLKSYLFAPEASTTWIQLNQQFRPNTEFYWLHYNFMGMIPTITLISFPFLWLYWGIKKVKVSKLILAITILSFILFLFFLKTEDGTTLYSLFYKLPGMNSIRVLNRFMHVALFMLLIALSYFLTKINRNWIYILLLAMIFDNAFTPSRTIRTEKASITQKRENVIDLVRKKLNGQYDAFAILDTETNSFETHIEAMQAALALQLPTINGYSSTGPVELGPFFRNVDYPSLKKWLDFNGINEEKVLIIQR